MNKLILGFTVSALTMITGMAFAQTQHDKSTDLRMRPEFYQLSPLEIKEVVPTAQELYSDYLPIPAPAPSSPATPSLIPGLDWNTMIVIGEKIIDIIKAGKPVVNVRRDTVAVVPMGVTAWTQLSGWQAPTTKVYNVTAKNGFGMSVVDLRLKVSMNYAGGVDGRGKFLANVVVVPTSISVLWGFTCDVWTEHQDPVNLGSMENPVAGLGFDIRFRYGSTIQEQVGAQDYFVSGLGEISELK